MSIEDLIKRYKTEMFNIERDISTEEDNLIKYQLRGDLDSFKATNERLVNLKLKLEKINHEIEKLENDDNDCLVTPIQAPTNIANNIKDLSIDDGTASFTFTATQETTGTINGKKVNTTQVQQVVKNYEVQDGEIISESVTETTKTHKQIKKDESIPVKGKLLK